MERIFNTGKCKEKRQNLRGNMTETEKILWTCLKGNQLLGIKFRRQYSIGYYLVDFYAAQLRQAIELDGSSHLAEGKPEYDEERELFIKAHGVRVIRFNNCEVRNKLSFVLNQIKLVIKSLN